LFARDILYTVPCQRDFSWHPAHDLDWMLPCTKNINWHDNPLS